MRFRTIPEAAKLLGVEEGWLRRMVREEKCPSVRVGNRRLVEMEAAGALPREAFGGIGVGELAEALGVKPPVIYRWAQEGYIPCARYGTEYRFDLDAVERALRARMGQEPADVADGGAK